MDIDEFYSELDRRMGIPDEDTQEYLQRVAAYTRRNLDNPFSPSITSGNVIERAAGNAKSTCKPREVKYESLRYDGRNRVEKRQTTPQTTSAAKRRKTSASQLLRDDHSENTTSVQSSGSSASNALLLQSSPANDNVDIDYPQPDSGVIYNEDSISFGNNVNASSIRYTAALPECGNMSLEQANIHDTIVTSSPEHSEEFNWKKVTGSYPQGKQLDSRTRSASVAPAVASEQPSPITSFQTTLHDSMKDLLPKKPVVTKPAAIDLLPLNHPKTKRSVRSKGKAKSNNDSTDDPPTSPIEDPSTSSISRNSVPLAAKSSLYAQLREKVSRHESMKKQEKLLKRSTSSGKDSLGMQQQQGKNSDSVASVKTSGNICKASTLDNPISKRHPIDMTLSTSKSTQIKKSTSSIPNKSKAKGREKEKNPKLLPHEYAQFLLDRVKEEPFARKGAQFLEGKTIFYTGGDYRQAGESTRKRMEIIIKHGGTLAPKFDPSTVTHIISRCSLGTAVDAMGLKRWRDIPDHIPTLTWNWVADALMNKKMTKEVFDEREIFLYAAYPERIDIGVKRYQRPRRTSSALGGSKRREESTEIARTSNSDSELDNDLGSRGSLASVVMSPSSPIYQAAAESEGSEHQSSSPVPSVCPLPVTDEDDPLAEFYAQAKAEHDAQLGRPGEYESDNDKDITAAAIRPPKREWTCNQKRAQAINCPNQDIIDKLEELKNLHDVKPGEEERWRVFTYSKCIPALRNYPKRIKSFSEARSIQGVGERTARKIMEIIETGNLTRIDYENTEDVQVTRLFTGIYGVGQSTAFKWYAAGCRTLEDLKVGKGGVKLSTAQEIGLRFYDDINDRMPRTEAKAIFDIIKPIALSIDPELFVEIMGSYRRGKADCGDIDILITRKPEGGKTHEGVLSRLIRELHAVDILTEDLALPEHPDDLEAIYRGLCRLPKPGSKRRRIDFLTVPWESRGAALLYYTGDDIFNRAIRLKANALGYSLNQKGLFKNVVRDLRDRFIKLNSGVILASETEREIFEILKVPWQEPHERVRR